MAEAPTGTHAAAQVLIVDDNPANLIALHAVISVLGVKIVAAESGIEAIALVAEREFAAVLLDVTMPGLDGLATLERMRALPNGRFVPVIFMTARDGDATTIERAYGLGAADYIVKPFAANVLRAKLRLFIDTFQKAQAFERKDRHVRMLAHDLRTPLSTVVMAASMLVGHDDPKMRELGARINRAAARMDALTRDVLAFSAPSAARLPLNPEHVDLVAICRSCIQDFEAVHPQVEFSHDLPESVLGYWDRARLEQALSNLIDNAVKYGAGWVKLSVQAGVEQVDISLENAGNLSAADLDALLKPFELRASRPAGAGFGVYIVREIARAHGGEVDVTAAQGSILFRLRLPYHLGRCDESAATNETLKLAL
jgi:two-component system sensor histidine kinase/response regulator